MSFVTFDLQRYATTYTTSTQTQTTATTLDTETQTAPTIIVMSEKTLVDKEHAERYVRKTIEYVQKHAFDGVKLVTDKDIDDFFDQLEAEAAVTISGGDSEDETIAGGDDTQEGGGSTDSQEGGQDNP